MLKITPNTLGRGGARTGALIGLIGLATLAAGCVEVGLPAEGSTTHAPLLPLFGMHDDPAFEDQQARTSPQGSPRRMRYPPPQTVPRFHRTTASSADKPEAKSLENPAYPTEKTLAYGKLAYDQTCRACHGRTGAGDGPVAGKNTIPNVPALTTERAAGFSDGKLYRIVSHGTGRMWSYKSQLEPMERWAVVTYVRALQRAERPEPFDRE